MSEVESTTDQTESNDPLWQVQLASGQICRMTLELLDDAFQDGLITENTLIMQDGTTEWVTLREVAGLDSDAESEAANGSAAQVNHAAPVANPPVAAAAPMQPAAPRQPAPYMDPFAPPIQAAPAVTQMVPPAAGHAAPFVFQGAGQQAGFVSAPPEPLTRSTAPVAADIDFDLDTVNFGKKRSPAKWIIGIAAVLGGLGFAAMNMSSETEIPAGPSAAAPVAAPAYQPTPAAQPAPITPAVTKPEPTRLSDDAKRALMEADKTRAAKMQQHRSPSRGGGAAPSGPRKSKDPFHKGGDKYDPLNASL
jgi:hypothetical protein